MAKKKRQKGRGRGGKRSGSNSSRTRLSKSGRPFGILSALRSGPILRRNSGAHKRATKASKELRILERVSGEPARQIKRGSSPTSTWRPDERLSVDDLPSILLVALAKPKVADLLWEYVSKCPDFWESQGSYRSSLWVPAYAELIQQLPGCRPIIDGLESNILMHATPAGGFAWQGMPEGQQALALAFFRTKKGIRELLAHVNSVKKKDYAKELKEFMEARDQHWECTGHFFEDELYGIVLLAALGSPEARDLAVHRYRTAESCADTSDSFLYLRDGPYLWGMVHTLVNLGSPYREKEVLLSGPTAQDPLMELAIPRIGGKAFAELNRRACREVARWYRRSTAGEDLQSGPGSGREHSSEVVAKMKLGYLSCAALAQKYDVPYHTLRKRISRFLKTHPNPGGIVTEVKDPKPRDPKFLVKESAVMHIIEKLRDEAERGPP